MSKSMKEARTQTTQASKTKTKKIELIDVPLKTYTGRWTLWLSLVLVVTVLLVDRVALPVEARSGGVISGRVTLADGTPCYYRDPYFGVDVSASVALLDERGTRVAGPVKVKPSGDYLLSNVPSGTHW